MSATPPPTPRTFVPAPRRSSHPLAGPPRPPLVNGSAVVAAAAVAFALLVCVVAWIVTHPHKAAAETAPEPVVVAVSAPTNPEALPPPPAPAVRPAPAEVTPALHRKEPREEVVRDIPPAEEAPPPLPPPVLPPATEEPPPAPVKEAPAAPAGDTYGTQVLFLNNPEAAADVARRERKLLFVMHISGNFEDSCFT